MVLGKRENLRLRWNEILSCEKYNKLTLADHINIILLAHSFMRVKIKHIAKEYNQPVASVTELVETARKERILPASPFGYTDEGLIDYRGFPLKHQLVRLQIVGVDFSYSICDRAGSLYDCNVKNSRFVEINFNGGAVANIFENCNFNHSSLKNGGFGSPSMVSFLDCTFINTDLTNAGARGAKFTRCSFERANMKKAHFFSCIFEECNFDNTKFGNGSLAGCKFISGCPRDKQFGNTIMDNVKIIMKR